MVYRKESCHLRKCLIMLGIISSRKALPFSHQPQGEYKCLKREFLQSASPNLEGRSVRTSGSVLLEEMNDRRYGSWREVAWLLVCCLFEHFPYRQMTMIWRLRGIWEYLRDD
jgi:hypothetical protein